MSKNKNGNNGFQNRAARRFKDNDKIDLISQNEIFEILDKDMQTILNQVSDHRNRVRDAKYPNYVGNMFANLSTPLFFYGYIMDHIRITKKDKMKTDLTEDDIMSLKDIIADAYKRSVTRQYDKQIQELDDRNKLLLKSFAVLDPKRMRTAKKLKLNKHMTRIVAILSYGDPRYNFKQLHKLFNQSSVSDKKKLKVLGKLYGKRLYNAFGAALTVNAAGSDILATIFSKVERLPRKKRTKVLLAYAEAYKLNGSTYHQLTKEFIKSNGNKKIVRQLKVADIGYKKAFKRLQSESNRSSDKKNRGATMVGGKTTGKELPKVNKSRSEKSSKRDKVDKWQMLVNKTIDEKQDR